jgi:hypothetical protein
MVKTRTQEGPSLDHEAIYAGAQLRMIERTTAAAVSDPAS